MSAAGPPWRDPVSGAEPDTFWASLPQEDRRAMARAGTLRSFARDAELVHQGQAFAAVLLLCSGAVEVFRGDADGIRTVLARRWPGQLIGEMAAVDLAPVSATVRAVEPVTALVLPGARFGELCRARPGITWLVLRAAVARLRDSDDHRQQYRLDVRRRTILCLIATAEAGRGQAVRGSVSLRLTQQQLADTVPAALVSVTRVLEDLRQAGALTTTRGRITVDVATLRLLAEGAS
ncbi:Crp/Fnr family transcriptional regulator [Amycolatopsis sp. H20-H5]|uniref:Crp/Fnr family transcriptional regulator n=1 Tax=Amycolatopsis sp. H20-H5 TaxID=3046309 RepID=UPI002DB67CB0|nr:Crp/Fnr family transcriptional regulator [Amycolatopsis sp. H20-H5]MEC3975713.1 Crp/Fnr family transcriptional regulator [Amycolatopsis sp. H20-H5]